MVSNKIVKLSTIINYCTNDYRTFAKCVEEVKKFSSQILVVTCDHFFNGEPEDRELLHSTYAEFPEISFIEFAHAKDELYSPYVNCPREDTDFMDYMHSTTRFISFFFIDQAAEYVLYLDSDEIIEGDQFVKWLKSKEYENYDAVRWLQHYYFRSAYFQAEDFQIGGLFAKKDKITLSALMHNKYDRCGIYHNIEGRKTEGISFMDKPFVHHYSWVKTKAECLLKAKSTPLHWEKDWDKIIEDEFSRDFQGKDFDGRSYRILEKTYFDPFAVPLPKKQVTQESFSNVRKVDKNEIRRRELAYSFGI